jgi:hypothetical protein
MMSMRNQLPVVAEPLAGLWNEFETRVKQVQAPVTPRFENRRGRRKKIR